MVTRYFSRKDMAVASVWIPPTVPTACFDFAGKGSSFTCVCSIVRLMLGRDGDVVLF